MTEIETLARARTGTRLKQRSSPTVTCRATLPASVVWIKATTGPTLAATAIGTATAIKTVGRLEGVASRIHAVTSSIATVALPAPVHEALRAVPSDPINAADQSFRVSYVLLASILVTRL